MKSFLKLAIAILLFSIAKQPLLAQSDFTLKTDIDTLTIVKGKSCTFKIEMTLPKEFSGWVVLHSSSELNERLSDTMVRSPYLGVTLTVNGTQKFEPGFYEITLSGEYFPNSGNNKALTRCYVRILPLPYNPAQWRIFESSFIPSFIQQDNEKNYWYNQCSIDGRGDALFKQGENTLIKKMNNSSDFFVEGGRRINPPTIDNTNGYIWLATRYNYSNFTLGGVIRYTLDGKDKTVFNYKNSPLPDSNATTIAVDSKGGAWIGTDKGLAYLLGDQWTIFTTSNSVLDKEPITSIVISGANVWVGTTNGLAKYDGTNWTRFTPQNSGMPAPFVWQLAAEESGDLWMGLSTSQYNQSYPIGQPISMVGVAKFDGKNWTLYNNQNSLIGINNYINSIAIDKKGNKWFSTASPSLGDSSNGGAKYVHGSGIVKFDNTSWIAYSTVNSPLIDNNINWVGLDNNGNIWFSSYIYIESGRFWGVYNEVGLPPFLAPPTSVEEHPEATDGITIYPNPTNTSFTISGADNILTVKLMNSLGIMVNDQWSMVNGQLNVNVADLASGVYFVQMRTSTGMITKSVVVSR